MATAIHTHDEYIDALRRLAGKARQEGVRLMQDARDGRYYASSVSTPGQLHYVTGVSCDCQGFIRHQRCKHYAALLSALGWLGTTPTPDAIAAAPPQARMTTHTGAVLEVVGTVSTLHTSSGDVDVSADVPADVAGVHGAIVAWWRQEVDRWARNAAAIDRELAYLSNAA